VASLPGVVVDDLQAKLKGDWTRSTSNKGYVGANYIHDGAVGKGDKSVAFTVKIPGDGKFEVRVAYAHGTNRDTKVPVLIRHADGEVTMHIDQTKRPPIDGHFISLGTFDFLVGEWEAVVISTEGTTAHVIADAVQFLSKNAPAVAKPAPKLEGKAAQAMLKKMESELKALKKAAVKQPELIAAPPRGACRGRCRPRRRARRAPPRPAAKCRQQSLARQPPSAMRCAAASAPLRSACHSPRSPLLAAGTY
jgi:hypothetical protein